MNNKDLKTKIASCDCAPCRAFTALLTQAGAKMLVRADAPGRLCEIAVIAAAGSAGLAEDKVEAAARAYADHLGVAFKESKRRDGRPGHILHAVQYSNHTPGVKPSDTAFNLGSARATEADGRVYVTWEPVFTPAESAAPNGSGGPAPTAPATRTIAIDWPAGVEFVEVDLANLGAASEVRQTIQEVKRKRRPYVFETTSTIEAMGDGRFRLDIHYDRERNSHIDPDGTWWGTTTMFLAPSDLAGVATWTDATAGVDPDLVTFRVIESERETTDEDSQEADEREIAARPISPTEKDLLIKARRGQGVFRAKVLALEPRCRLTGTADPHHLRASHIKPWAESTDIERLDGCNGLMLAPHVDHLFDRALISFTDEGKLLVVDDRVRALLAAWGLGDDQRTMEARPFTPRQCEYLRTHRRRLHLLMKAGK